MNALVYSSGGGNTPPAITSLDISEMTGVRHDNVRRTVETLAERGVVTLPQIEEKPTKGRPTLVYVFSGEQGKRDSIVVVAQLSPEFTARLVDRWKELESAVVTGQIPRLPRVDVARENRLTMNMNLRLAKAVGLLGNQAVLAANRATTAMTGVDNLRLLGVTHIDAPQNEALMSPTDIGKRFGVGPGRTVNTLLCQLGLQSAFRDAKGHLQYEPTEAGKRVGGTMQDTGKSHGSGVPVRQLRWPSSVGAMLLNDNASDQDIA